MSYAVTEIVDGKVVNLCVVATKEEAKRIIAQYNCKRLMTGKPFVQLAEYRDKATRARA